MPRRHCPPVLMTQLGRRAATSAVSKPRQRHSARHTFFEGEDMRAMVRRRSTALLVATAAVSLVAAGCSSSKKNTATPSSVAPATSAAASTAASLVCACSGLVGTRARVVCCGTCLFRTCTCIICGGARRSVRDTERSFWFAGRLRCAEHPVGPGDVPRDSHGRAGGGLLRQRV